MALKQKLISAYLWQLLGNWIVRSIGVVSTLILVRLLEPSDFGIIAIAMMCMGLFEQFTNFGISRYLILKTELNEQLLDSCWTLGILIRIVLIILVVATAGLIADYVNTPEIKLVLIVIAIGGLFPALNSMGIIKLQRSLSFRPLTKINVISKIVSTIITLLIAWFYPTYWALVFGSISMTIIYMIGSYFVSPYRPAINFHFEKKMFSYSIYMILRGLIGYSRSKLDTLLVGRLFDSSSVGKYSIGQEFAILPQIEIVTPAATAIFPGLSQFKNDPEQLFDKTYKFLALVYLLIIPSIVGIQVIADQFCAVVLGAKWADTGPIMAALAFLMLPFSLTAQTNNLFDYLNKARWSLASDLIGIGLLLGAFINLKFETVADFAETRSTIGLLAFGLIIIYCRFTIGLSIIKMLEILLPPTLGAIGMWAFFHYIFVAQDLTLTDMIINLLNGAIIYGLAMIGILFTLRNRSPLWGFWWGYLAEHTTEAINRMTRK